MNKIVQGDKLELTQTVTANVTVGLPPAVSTVQVGSPDRSILAFKLRQNTRP